MRFSDMVVSGLPIRNGDLHAGEIASVSLDLLSSMCDFKIRHMPGTILQLRIGMHSGRLNHYQMFICINEPRCEKTCFCHMQTTKVQISLCIRAV